MTHDAIVSSLNLSIKSIRAPGHECVLMAMLMLAAQGVLRAGLVISKNSAGAGVPYENLTQVLGTGDGSTKAFTGTIAGAPLDPGSVAVTDGTETFADDGHGTLTGSAAGTGTVNYATGAASISFYANVADTEEVTVTSARQVVGVLDRDVDTAKAVDCAVVIHGTVKEGELLKGAAGAACVAADFARLRRCGIYPV